ncbi:MAG: hypothetical protein K8T91_23155 [Planctomycetes bacterium]|nr:hypothetical protein [Planctomycetota bacterium]
MSGTGLLSGASKTAGAVEAGAGMMGALGVGGGLTEAAAALAGGFSAVLAPVAAVAVGYSMLSSAMGKFTDSLIEGQKHLGERNGTVAAANAHMTLQGGLQDMETGQRTGASYKYLAESKMENKQAWLKWEAAWTNFNNNLAGMWNYFEAGIGTVIENFPGVKEALDAMAEKSESEALPLNAFLHDAARNRQDWKVNPPKKD